MMTVDFTQPVLSMPDGSYVVQTQGPAYPYNVLPGDPMWQSIQDWLAAGNKADDYVPPTSKAIILSPAQEQTNALIAALPGILLTLATGTGTDPLSVALQSVLKGET
jgi:hypothetical protein